MRYGTEPGAKWSRGPRPAPRVRPTGSAPAGNGHLLEDRLLRHFARQNICRDWMNRPSLYAAFGDKRALYLEALARYWQISLTATREALAGDRPLDEALMLAYEPALSIYFSGDDGLRGCFVIGTAVTEAVEDPEIRDRLAAGFRTIDADFEARLRMARERGGLKDGADPAALSVLATATMRTIAIRFLLNL